MNKELLLSVAAVAFGCGLVALTVLQQSSNAVSVSGDSSPVTISRGTELSHVYGDENAATKIVEFSDLTCGFCARLHPDLKRLIDESDGTISWEYRHLPVLSQRSFSAAVASECVHDELGDDAFWGFLDVVFENQSSVSDAWLRDRSIAAGLSDSQYSECLNDIGLQSRVSTDLNAGRTLGARGTPFSIILYPDGTSRTVPGALPFSQWKAMVEPS